jgi:hypothetical protein
VATKDHSSEKNHNRSTEQEALEGLRQHRQQSGYTPWNNDDNEQLRALDHKQKQQAREQQAQREGEQLYQRLVAARPSLVVMTGTLPRVSEASQPATVPETPPEVQPQPLTIRIDPELARLALGLNRASLFRVWAVARHHFGQPGWVDKDTLLAALQQAGVLHTRRHLNRLLKEGGGIFWNLSTRNRVYLRGYVTLTKQLTKQALREAPELIKTNWPGVRSIYINPGGTLAEFKAQVYNAWLAYRESPTIARRTLCSLFNCTEDTLRNWEEILGDQLVITPTYAQCASHPLNDDRVYSLLPDHCYVYATKNGQVRHRWRLPNTYNPKNVRHHAHKGQSRKARTQAALTVMDQPVEKRAAADLNKICFDRSHRVPKQYFKSPKALRAFLKRLERRNWTGESTNIPHYIFRGVDRNQHVIYELSIDGEIETTPNERLSIKKEPYWWQGYRLWQDVQRRSRQVS